MIGLYIAEAALWYFLIRDLRRAKKSFPMYLGMISAIALVIAVFFIVNDAWIFLLTPISMIIGSLNFVHFLSLTGNAFDTAIIYHALLFNVPLFGWFFGYITRCKSGILPMLFFVCVLVIPIIIFAAVNVLGLR